MVAATPWQGGATWAVLQYVLGFRQLGHEVYFIEPISGTNLAQEGTSLADSDNAAYFSRIAREFDFEDHAALLLAGTRETTGVPYSRLEQIARRADVLVNISGMLCDENLLRHIPIRVYLDLDPAFNQLWSSVDGIDMRFAGHTHHATIGLNIGETDCPVPTCGLNWLKTLQPVCLPHWPVAGNGAEPGLTTIGNWRAYGSIVHQGVQYGQKAHSLRQFMELPNITSERFRLALAIHADETADLARLNQHGWELLDPGVVASTPDNYRVFIQNSKAELGICKSGYAASRCGWFSDRSLCYLASGRPVIAQNTGFDRHLPCGTGLLSFSTTEEAAGAIEDLNADYPRHRLTARDIAKEYFDSDKVLGRLLAQVGA
jgi:hypothetical protein